MSAARSLHNAFAAAFHAATPGARADVDARAVELVSVLREDGWTPEAAVLEVKRIARFAGADLEHHGPIVGNAVSAAIAAYFR